MVRSPPFQGVDAGSIPVETTKCYGMQTGISNQTFNLDIERCVRVRVPSVVQTRERANVGELGWSVKPVAYA